MVGAKIRPHYPVMKEQNESSHYLGENVPRRIILIGFRATGKSSVGRQLADQLNYGFIDTDKVLLKRLSCSIAEYVAANGWAEFRNREAELLLELSELTAVVIATGGGAVVNQHQWVIFRKNSLVIWLQADVDSIRKRLARDQETATQRPCLTTGSTVAEVETVLLEREPLYQNSSDIALDTVANSPTELVQEILLLLAGRFPWSK